MLVIAKPGTRCPKEKKPRHFIDDQDAQEVPDTAFYRRMIADGSLVIAQKAASGEPKKNVDGSPAMPAGADVKPKNKKQTKNKGGKL